MVDSSNPQMEAHMKTVYETLDNLGVGDKPVITVFNKQDKLEDEGAIFRDSRADYLVNASIKQGKGIDKILQDVEEIIRNSKKYIAKTFSYNDAGKIQYIRKYGELLKEEYTEDGIYVEAYVPAEMSL